MKCFAMERYDVSCKYQRLPLYHKGTIKEYVTEHLPEQYQVLQLFHLPTYNNASVIPAPRI